MKKDHKKFTKKEMKTILTKSINQSGIIHILVMSMEEISELIDVIAKNSKKVNYIHTAEEIVDVLIMAEYMKIIFSVKEEDMKYKGKKKKLSQMDYIINLCSCQKDISKFLRRNNMRKRCERSIPLLEYMANDIAKYYNIKKKDLDKIRSIKLERVMDRLMNNDIR